MSMSSPKISIGVRDPSSHGSVRLTMALRGCRQAHTPVGLNLEIPLDALVVISQVSSRLLIHMTVLVDVPLIYDRTPFRPRAPMC